MLINVESEENEMMNKIEGRDRKFLERKGKNIDTKNTENENST